MQLKNRGLVKLEVNDRSITATLSPGVGKVDTTISEQVFLSAHMINGSQVFHTRGLRAYNEARRLKSTALYSLRIQFIIDPAADTPFVDKVLIYSIYLFVPAVVVKIYQDWVGLADGWWGNEFVIIISLLPLLVGALLLFDAIRTGYRPEVEATRYTDDYKKKLWNQLRGLYIYFKVSGADIFNYEPGKLDASNDELTPYYIAARL